MSKQNGSTKTAPPRAPMPAPEVPVSREARAARRARLKARLDQLSAAGLIAVTWLTDFQVRVSHRDRAAEMYDFWTSTTAWRLVGSGAIGSRGWPGLLKALGLEQHIGPHDN